MNEIKGKSHCSVVIMPVPVFVNCLKCGYEVELWSDEEETVCPLCGNKIFMNGATVH